mmetsp:Transcript_122558/g.392223  ORF Transcript_122558/g.392223 Transcript_122558/m.392223 type:complete len:145 (+) Transcript_122558:2731-3165(+)
MPTEAAADLSTEGLLARIGPVLRSKPVERPGLSGRLCGLGACIFFDGLSIILELEPRAASGEAGRAPRGVNPLRGDTGRLFARAPGSSTPGLGRKPEAERAAEPEAGAEASARCMGRGVEDLALNGQGKSFETLRHSSSKTPAL